MTLNIRNGLWSGRIVDSVRRGIATGRKRSVAGLGLLTVVSLLVVGCAERDEVRATVILLQPTVTAAESAPAKTAAATVVVTIAVPEVTSAVEPKTTSTAAPKPTATNVHPTSTSLPASIPTTAPTTVISATLTPTSTTASATATPIATTATMVATSSPASPTNTPVPPEPTTVFELVIDTELAEVGSGIYASNCTGCHSKGTDRIIGPGHASVYNTAATRVEGLSAEDYLSQSIREPKAFVVPGFSPVMPSFTFLSDDQILALIEFLKTL